MCSVVGTTGYVNNVIYAYFVPFIYFFTNEGTVSIFLKLSHVDFDISPSSFFIFLWLNNPDSGTTIYL